MDNLNKTTNDIVNLNKKDLDKAQIDDKDKDHQYDKLVRLVNNLNSFNFYVRNLVKDRVGNKNNKKELPEIELNKI